MGTLVQECREQHKAATGGLYTSATVKVDTVGDLCLIRMIGRFVAGESPEYLDMKRAEIAEFKCSRALVDLTDVVALGSEGLSFIADLFHAFEHRVVFAGARPRVREVFRITGLSSVLTTAIDIETGLWSLRNFKPQGCLSGKKAAAGIVCC
jgi:anti-anti-sigma factor